MMMNLATSSPFSCNVHDHHHPPSSHIDLWCPQYHTSKWKKEEDIRSNQIISSIEQTPDLGASGGVSSLVRKWRGFEADSSGRSTASAPSEEEWEESDKTVGPPSRGGDERERLRVADIIKKWTEEHFNDFGSESSPPRLKTLPSDYCSEYKNFGNSPRIRGRHALNHFLNQKLRDRNKELEALIAQKRVSGFTHRGRIQAALRIKLLRGGPEQERRSSIQPHKDLKVVRENSDKECRNTLNTKENQLQLMSGSRTSHEQSTSHFQEEHSQEVHKLDEMDEKTNVDISVDRGFEKLPSVELSPSTQPSETCGVTAASEGLLQKMETDMSDSDDCKSEVDGNASFSNWDDVKNEEGIDGDWMDEISRPRSDWEALRKERYQEMLDPFFVNEDIRTLLGRKSVSTFLSSSMRENIDRVMIRHGQGQQPSIAKHEIRTQEVRPTKEDEALCVDQTRHHVIQQVGGGEELSDCSSFQVVCPSTQQSSPSSRYNSEGHTDNDHASIREMQAINDMREHMERLHLEISELRRSIKCCMHMQIKLQRSIKKEVATMSTNHSDLKNRHRKSSKKANKNGGRCWCCVCSKTMAECVLYRCGHMCTCFKCGQELQWSSNKCPLCAAPIDDIILVHPSSYNI